MIIQLIGNPTTGKSTFIKKFIKDNNDWIWLDIAEWNRIDRNWLKIECDLINQLSKNKNYIVESIMGFHQLKNSLNIKFTCELKDLEYRHYLRKEQLDNNKLDYYSALSFQSVKPNLIINTSIHTTYEQIISILNPYIQIST